MSSGLTAVYCLCLHAELVSVAGRVKTWNPFRLYNKAPASLYFFFPLSGRYEYSQNFRDSQSSDGSGQVPSEFGTNMVYYYDDGSKVQMYTVDEKLLKEYIKRQM